MQNRQKAIGNRNSNKQNSIRTKNCRNVMRKVRHGACTEALMPSWYGQQWVEIDSIGEF